MPATVPGLWHGREKDMLTCEVKRMNRDHDILTVLQWYDDDQITSKHYRFGVMTAFQLAAESYENDDLLILIYDDVFHHVLKLYMTTTVSGSDIYADVYANRVAIWYRGFIRRMRIAC